MDIIIISFIVNCSRHDIQCSPEGKCKICDTIKDKINSSWTVAVIQCGPRSWTNSIIFITIAESRWMRIRRDVAHNEQLHFCTMYFINLHVQSISMNKVYLKKSMQMWSFLLHVDLIRNYAYLWSDKVVRKGHILSLISSAVLSYLILHKISRGDYPRLSINTKQ